MMPTVLQHFAWIPLRLFMKFFCSLRIKGQGNITGLKGNVIIASNHTSELDPLFVVAALPFFSSKLPLIFVSREKSFYKNSSFKFLYGGRFFRMMGAYPAYVGLNNYKLALRHHLEAINKGRSVCIFPVGKKHRLHEIAQAKGGVSYLAQTTSLPIVPVLFEGLGGLKFKDYLRGACKLTVTFGKPLYSKDILAVADKAKGGLNRTEHEESAVKVMEHIARLSQS